MNASRIISGAGTVGAYAATVSDLASIPRNSLVAVGKAGTVAYTALAYLGGAAAALAGTAMTIRGAVQTASAKTARTRVDGSFTMVSGVAFAMVGIAFCFIARGHASWILAFPAAGIPMGGLLGLRTLMRISEINDFRKELKLAKASGEDIHSFLAKFDKEALSRIFGDEKIESFEGADKISYISLKMQQVLLFLLIQWIVSMAVCGVNSNSSALPYLFGGGAALWLSVDSKGVWGLKWINQWFESQFARRWEKLAREYVLLTPEA